MRKTIEVHLDYIQKNFVGEMRADIGQHASRYKTTRKLLEQTSEEISRGMEETKYTLQQLANLKQALMEQATHDAQGNPMDETYVKKAIGRETEEAGKLIKSSKLLPENVTKAKRFFLEQSPKIQFWVDSIPAIQETATDIK
ncbi:MAG: hypothetical protein ACKVOR_10400 [Flavobacteriales bacterium]